MRKVPSNAPALRQALQGLGVIPNDPRNIVSMRRQLAGIFASQQQPIPGRELSVNSDPADRKHFKPRIRDGELSVNSDPAELIRTVNMLKSGLKKRMRSIAPVGKASYDFFEGILQRNGD